MSITMHLCRVCSYTNHMADCVGECRNSGDRDRLSRKDMAAEPEPRTSAYGLARDAEDGSGQKGVGVICHFEAELAGLWVHVTYLDVMLDQG